MATLRNGFGCLSVMVGLAIAAGCSSNSGYPQPAVTSPIGRSGVCATCSKTIDSVNSQNLVTKDGIQFIVCSDECKAQATGDKYNHDH